MQRPSNASNKKMGVWSNKNPTNKIMQKNISILKEYEITVHNKKVHGEN